MIEEGLRHVRPIQLEIAELDSIGKVLAEDWQKLPLGELIYQVETGRASIYRLFRKDEYSGLFVIRVVETPVGREMFIWIMTGQGLFSHGEEIWGLMKQLAKMLNCKWITSQSKESVARVLEKKTNMEKKYSFMCAEVE